MPLASLASNCCSTPDGSVLILISRHPLLSPRRKPGPTLPWIPACAGMTGWRGLAPILRTSGSGHRAKSPCGVASLPIKRRDHVSPSWRAPDAPDTGFGAFWGEVQTHVHAGLGCVGVITDGSVRDLDAMSPGFFVLAGSVMPSHAHVHLVEFGGTVSVGGMVVSANDIIHADRHGAVVIPADTVAKIPAAVDLLARRERVLIDASKQPGFSIERLRQAYREQDEIH